MLRYIDHLLLYNQIDKLKKENQELKDKIIDLIINKNIISIDEFELLFRFNDDIKPKFYPLLPPSSRSSFSED
jgi:hypothetical protein